MSGGSINATELVASLVNRGANITEGIKIAQDAIDGSMSILILTPKGIFAARDKFDKTPVVIGKNCFVGCNALILKGTRLGDGCIVGAGAVVSGEFPAGSVIAGNPARVIRTVLPQGETAEEGGETQ